jgi:hypothetical protein
MSTAGHPITITNVLPAPFYQTSDLSSLAGTPAPDMPSQYTPIDRLNIPGFRDDAVKEYCAWQQSQVKDLALKREYQTACDVTDSVNSGPAMRQWKSKSRSIGSPIYKDLKLGKKKNAGRRTTLKQATGHMLC